MALEYRETHFIHHDENYKQYLGGLNKCQGIIYRHFAHTQLAVILV